MPLKKPEFIPQLGKRLSRTLALLSMLGLGLVCVAVYWTIAVKLATRQQESLAHKQATVQHLLIEGRQAHSREALVHMLGDFLAGHEELSLRVMDGKGRLLFEHLRQPLSDGRSQRRDFSVDLPPTQALPAAQPLQVSMLLDKRDDEALLRHLAWTLGLAAVLGSLLVSMAGTWMVRRGLQPLHLLVEQTRQLSAQDLGQHWHKRLDDRGQPKELRPLVAQFNALLDRLAVAYQQMEAFNADVAHELNTPLTTLISSCELALRKPRDALELRDILASNLEDLQRMAGIVADMLFLAHADRGEGARRTPVASLAQLVAEVAEFHEAALQEADVQVQVRGDACAEVDVRLLRRALSNLLGNATRFATPGSVIELLIEVRPGAQWQQAQGDQALAKMVALIVRNQGSTIDASHLPRLFDRFYRSDSARAQADRNHGLGLAIVAAIARMHGGQTLAESARGMTDIGLLLPTVASPATGSV